MSIEDELRGALDQPAPPPPPAALEEVLRRGKRRLAVQRAGMVLAALAVVAVIGVGSVAWPARSAPMANPADWPRVAVPVRTPAVLSDGTASKSCGAPAADLVEGLGLQRLTADQQKAWLAGAQEALPGVELGTSIAEDIVNTYEFDVLDVRGGGSVRLVVGTFTGDALAAADKAVWATGDCQPPRRTVLPNGTVLQLYDVRDHVPFDAELKTMFVFRPDGRLFRLELLNATTAATARTRDTMPLTEEQFAKLGPVVAEVA